jgi:DNA-binding NtrC family response regulator
MDVFAVMTAPAFSVLLVDDHPEVCDSLAAFIQQLGHRAVCEHDPRQALERIQMERPDLVLSDLRMPGMTGLELLEAMEGLDQPPPLALMTAFGDAETAIKALRMGAVDYLRKPVDVRELHQLIERFTGGPGLTGRMRTPMPPDSLVDDLLVAGAAIAKVVQLADRLHRAPDLPCLIEAETGCGKELIARRIHHGGRPAQAGPFVALNCAAIAPGLFEAELFGYAAGSFTGALAGGSPGKLALAAGGTLLLDEVAELPLDQQAKLLRVLESRSWYPVGSNQLQRLKARVMCACNARLLSLVGSGRFREDLYYRLKVGHLTIPPLRERRDEILPLANHFLQTVRRERGRGFQKLSSDAETFLLAQDWPGNIRQLHHVLEQAAILFDGAVLDVRHLTELMPDAKPMPDATMRMADALGALGALGTTVAKAQAGQSTETPLPLDPTRVRLPHEGLDLDAWIRAVVEAALERHDGSPVRTAAYLGITRKVLYTLRKRYGLLTGGRSPT